MEDSLEISAERREEMMVSLTGSRKPTKRLAHFLKHNTSSVAGPIFELPSHCLSTVPNTFDPKNWPLKVKLQGWRLPPVNWETWVIKMAALHESTWKKAGIYEAILSSTYVVRRNYDLVFGLAEKWCPETKSFIFPWGEATITLEDMLISGFSVLGSPVFIPLATEESKEMEDKLNQSKRKRDKSTTGNAEHSAWMRKFMDSGSEIEHEAFLTLWLSRFVFPRSTQVVKSIFSIAIHLARGTRIALGPAVLASIYRDLSLLKEKIAALTKLVKFEDDDSELEVTIRSPLQLVLIWAWERFMELRPKPNVIKSGEPRFARWHKVNVRVENVRTVLDSSAETFDWRPYAKTLTNWKLPEFYREKELWVLIDGDLSEELQSLGRCLRVSELVGIDCIEQYLPHRVAMQFGMDQDLPAFVGRANETPFIAWCHFSKPISYANFYIPSRLYEADVTSRYLEWWQQSFSRMQVRSGGVPPQKQVSSSSKMTPKRSERVKSSSFIGFRSMLERAKQKNEIDNLSGSSITAKRSNRTRKKNFFEKIMITTRRFEGMKGQDVGFVHPSFSPTDLKNSPETSKWMKRDTDDSFAVGSPLKREKKSVQSSNEMKEAKDESASTSLTSNKLPLSLIVKKEADDSLVPPGFPPRFYVTEARDSSKEDDLAITDSPKSSNKQIDVQNTKAGDCENSSCQSPIFPPLNADNGAVKITAPLTALGPDTVMESAPESGASFHGHDMALNQGNKGDGENYASEVPDKLEAWVGRLEAIVAEMKAARFGHRRPISSSK